MTLRDLSEEYMSLLELAEDDEIDEQTFKDTMEGLQGEIEAKADAYAVIIKSLQADSKLLDDEEKRLKKRRDTIDNNIDRMKRNLEAGMIACGKPKFKTELFSFRIQKNAPALVYDKNIDINTLPAEFVKFGKPTVDTEAVKKAIKDGVEIDWAKLESSESIRIS